MTSSNVINGQVHTRQVITNIQYQIVGVYWVNDSTPFVDWYFDVIFITENLTPYRTNPTKRLSQLKFDKQIAAYWTSDGRIFVKRTETSREEIVTNFDDITSLECRSHRQSMRNSQDSPPVLARSPEHPRPETESVV
jgi:hypothetical protein